MEEVEEIPTCLILPGVWASSAVEYGWKWVDVNLAISLHSQGKPQILFLPSPNRDN